MNRPLIPPDPTLRFTTTCLVLLTAYFLTTSINIQLPLVEAAWSMLLLFSLFHIRTRALGITLLLHLLLALLYLVGTTIDFSNTSDSSYLRTILTSFVFCSITVSTLGGKWIYFRNTSHSENFHIFIHRAALTAISLLCIFAYLLDRSASVTDAREITGFNYLTISDLISLFSLATLSRKNISIAEYITTVAISFVALILMGSRTAIILYPACSLAYFLVRFGSPLKSAMLIIIASATFFSLLSAISQDSPLLFRVSTLLNFSADDSLNYRTILTANFFKRLDTYPECLLVPCHPLPGEYVHSMLSLVEYFGALGLLAFVAFPIVLFSRLNRFINSALLPIFLYTLACMLMARSWVSPLFPVFLGFFVSAVLPRDSSVRITEGNLKPI